ncbi:VWA domain-containing protein [uncultured Brachyspira sp.]|uniref:VWA domain-containing protein n=1 Tax=uncultured Brachyspira sp. TaxID=221953 RepID=UPI0026377DCB|nr:VWA domain-containing protein [uncultured Brachyspira sp.]
MSDKKKLIIPELKKGNLSINTNNKLKSVNLNRPNISKIFGEENSIKKEIEKSTAFDLLLIGDLTGSMEMYREVLKNKFKEISKTLFKLINNLRIGIIFYLDHGSGDPYVTKIHELSKDTNSLFDFIKNTPNGHGGDEDEAVEDALNDALNINWNQKGIKSIVLFGDAKPHQPHECPEKLDYFKIVEKLYKNKITVNTVYCADIDDVENLYKADIGDFSKRTNNLNNGEFFSWAANVTGGIAIGINNIDDIVDIIQAMAAKDAGKIDELEKEVKNNTASIKIPVLKKIKEQSIKIEEKKKILGISNK